MGPEPTPDIVDVVFRSPIGDRIAGAVVGAFLAVAFGAMAGFGGTLLWDWASHGAPIPDLLGWGLVGVGLLVAEGLWIAMAHIKPTWLRLEHRPDAQPAAASAGGETPDGRIWLGRRVFGRWHEAGDVTLIDIDESSGISSHAVAISFKRTASGRSAALPRRGNASRRCASCVSAGRGLGRRRRLRFRRSLHAPLSLSLRAGAASRAARRKAISAAVAGVLMLGAPAVAAFSLWGATGTNGSLAPPRASAEAPVAPSCSASSALDRSAARGRCGGR
ncbi:MAG: hypothetical protein U0575_15985 [Phycisphaerales bacterium]